MAQVQEDPATVLALIETPEVYAFKSAASQTNQAYPTQKTPVCACGGSCECAPLIASFADETDPA